MNIRRGTIADLPTVRELNQALFRHEHDEHFYEGEKYNLDWPNEEDGMNYFKDCLGGSPSAALFLAEADGIAVGYLAASYYTRTYRIPSQVGYLDNMYVSPDFRDAGVGSALIDAFKGWARSHNVGLIRVSAMAKNTRAHSFYRRNGFKDQEVTLEQSLTKSEHE